MHIRVIRLWPRKPQDGSLPLGLSCTDEGLLIAGNCRLIYAALGRDGHVSYCVRPQVEIEALLQAGYGTRVDASPFMPALAGIARYLTQRNWSSAAIAALHLRFPELPSQDAARRVLRVDALLKTVHPSVFDPAKHPRWPAGSEEGHGGEFRPVNFDGDGGFPPTAQIPQVVRLLVAELLRRLPWLLRQIPRLPEPPAEPLPPPEPTVPAKPPSMPRPAEPVPESPPVAEEPPQGIGHNRPPEPIEPAEVAAPPRLELPEEAPAQSIERYQWGRRIADALQGAIKRGDVEEIHRIAEAVDRVRWLSDQVPNILSYLDPPKSYEELASNALVKGPHPGYEDHHIVEQGKHNDYLDQDRIQDHSNKVRIPYYLHKDVQSYYQRPDPDLDDLAPRQYLHGKSFDEQFEFGVRTLRKLGIMQ